LRWSFEFTLIYNNMSATQSQENEKNREGIWFRYFDSKFDIIFAGSYLYKSVELNITKQEGKWTVDLQKKSKSESRLYACIRRQRNEKNCPCKRSIFSWMSLQNWKKNLEKKFEKNFIKRKKRKKKKKVRRLIYSPTLCHFSYLISLPIHFSSWMEQDEITLKRTGRNIYYCPALQMLWSDSLILFYFYLFPTCALRLRLHGINEPPPDFATSPAFSHYVTQRSFSIFFSWSRINLFSLPLVTNIPILVWWCASLFATHRSSAPIAYTKCNPLI
jgi:hypothetical protein